MLKALIVMQFSSCQCHRKCINVYIDINVYQMYSYKCMRRVSRLRILMLGCKELSSGR